MWIKDWCNSETPFSYWWTITNLFGCLTKTCLTYGTTVNVYYHIGLVLLKWQTCVKL